MDELWKYKVFATHSVAAAGSVALGTAITYPFDTVKVISQVCVKTRLLFYSAYKHPCDFFFSHFTCELNNRLLRVQIHK